MATLLTTPAEREPLRGAPVPHHFRLDGKWNVWVVKSGKVDIFLQMLEKDGKLGARSHVVRIEQGQAAFGIDTSTHPELALTAIPHPGTEIIQQKLEQLFHTPGPLPQSSPATLLQDWITNLFLAAEGMMVPKEFELLVAGASFSTTEQPAAIVPGEEILWVKHLAGRSQFIGQNLRVRVEGHFPLSKRSRSWLQLDPESSVAAIDLSTLKREDPDWNWLGNFHSVVLACLVHNRKKRDEKRQTAIIRQKQSDSVLIHRTLVNLASPLETEQAAGAATETLSQDSLLAACRKIGAHTGINFRPAAAAQTGLEQKHAIEAIAKAAGVRYRRVVLKSDWWQRDSGFLLAFLREPQRPVALLPKSDGKYQVYDPVENTTTRVTGEISASLEPFAYSFYRPFPLTKITGRDLLQFALQISRKELFMIGIMGVAGGLLSMVFPIVTGIIFDSVIPGAERQQLVQLTFLLLITALATAFFTLVRSFAVLRLEARVDAAAQGAMWDRLLRLPIPFFRQYSSGDLAVRSLAMNQIREILTNSTLASILSGIFSIFSFILLFYYSWWLALLASGLVMIALVLSVACSVFQLRHLRQTARMRGKISSMLLQFINGVTKFRVSGTENRAFAAWAHAFTQQKQLYLKSRRISTVLAVFNSAFPVLALAVIFWFAAPLVGQSPGSSISTGAFLAFLAAFVQFLTSALQLSSSVSTILGIVPVYERAVPIFHTLPEVDEQKSNPGELKGGIEVSHVSFRYAADTPLVLRDVSFSVRPGEFVAFTGPSGSGKSTLLRLLLGFEVPESGTISYDGQDITGVDIQAVRQQIGVVLQSGRLISGSVLENIIGSLPLTVEQAWEAARLAGLDRDIKALPMGMHTFVSDGGGGFSGGQRQRLMIARAIVNKPRILLFDEATSALDNQTQAIVSRSLATLQATRVVIAHRLSTIMSADRIFVFDQGSIVQSGNYQELVSVPGLFRDLVKRQVV